MDGRRARAAEHRRVVVNPDPRGRWRIAIRRTEKAYNTSSPTGDDHLEQGSEQASVYELLADGFAAKRAAVAGRRRQRRRLAPLDTRLVDLFLQVDPQSPRFTNQRFVATTLLLVPFIKGRLSHHAAQGDEAYWVHHTAHRRPRGEARRPDLRRARDLTLALKGDDEAHTALNALVSYLLDEVQQSDAFQVALTAVADLLQLLVDDGDLVPLLRAAGNALDPELGAVASRYHVPEPRPGAGTTNRSSPWYCATCGRSTAPGTRLWHRRRRGRRRAPPPTGRQRAAHRR